jgi:hypothetical protein
MSRLNRLNIVNIFSAGAVPWTYLWSTETLFYELWEQRKTDINGNLVGLIRGEVLTKSGTPGSEVYRCPDTAGYKAADIDNLWFTAASVQRDVLTNNLRGYDFARTIVRYQGQDPYSIEAIAILNVGAVIPEELKVRFYGDFKLSPWWSGSWVDLGEVKENRAFEYTPWVP